MNAVNFSELGIWLNENQGITAVIISTLPFAVVGIYKIGWFLWKRGNKALRSSEIINVWGIPNNHKETEDFFIYEFIPTLQNKSGEIIKNLWINFSTSGFNLKTETTNQTSLFDGWNMRNEAMHLVSKDEYKFSPQNLIEPFKIIVELRKSLPAHGAWIYLSYGAPGINKSEVNGKVSYRKLRKFIKDRDHSTEAFLNLLGVTRKSWFKKFIKQFYV